MSEGLTAEELAALDAAAQQAEIAPPAEGASGGRWVVRPGLALGRHAGDPGTPAYLGVELGRAVWKLPAPDHVLGAGGYARIAGSWPCGPDTRGHDYRLGATGGPTVGPVGLQLGPDLAWSAESWDGGSLPDAALLGGRAVLTGDLGLVSAYVGHAAWWILGDDRAPASGGWPGVGDEPEWLAGVGVRLGPVQLRADGSHRETSAGAIERFGLGVRIQP